MWENLSGKLILIKKTRNNGEELCVGTSPGDLGVRVCAVESVHPSIVCLVFLAPRASRCSPSALAPWDCLLTRHYFGCLFSFESQFSETCCPVYVWTTVGGGIKKASFRFGDFHLLGVGLCCVGGLPVIQKPWALASVELHIWIHLGCG